MGAREGGWWGSEARLRGHHRRQECRRSVGWATLLSPLLLESLPTKTSFGTDGKKQLYFPTNDLQKLFLESPPTKTSFGTDGKKQLSFPTNDLQKLFLESKHLPKHLPHFGVIINDQNSRQCSHSKSQSLTQ